MDSLPGQGLVPTGLAGRVRCLQLFLGSVPARGQRLRAAQAELAGLRASSWHRGLGVGDGLP